MMFAITNQPTIGAYAAAAFFALHQQFALDSFASNNEGPTTIVGKQASIADMWGQAESTESVEEQESEKQSEQNDDVALGFPRRIKTIRFSRAGSDDITGSVSTFALNTSPDEVIDPEEVQSASYGLASASSRPVELPAAGKKASPSYKLASLNPSDVAVPTERTETGPLAKLDEVERYLWEVYQRVPEKRDASGNFTWKDPAAAKRFGVSMPAYVISGMDPDFREQLYHMGKAMDAAGVKWAILSAFRDDYRQRLASGFKASARNSLHGGSARTGGYGHGRAVDVSEVDGDPEIVWKWIDAHGAKYGLHRPMRRSDPPHVQSLGDWRKLAGSLRQARLKSDKSRTAAADTRVKGKVADSSQ